MFDASSQLRSLRSDLARERDEAAAAVRARHQRDAILGRPSEHLHGDEDSAHAGLYGASGSAGGAEALILVTVASETNPERSFTFPSSTATWTQFAARHDAKPHGTGRVVLSSSHARRGVVLHSEVLRQIMLATGGRHVVMTEGRVVDSQVFWPTWQVAGSGAEGGAGSRAGVQTSLAGGLRSSCFPGELLPPLGPLMSPHEALMRKQSMFPVV